VAIASKCLSLLKKPLDKIAFAVEGEITGAFLFYDWPWEVAASIEAISERNIIKQRLIVRRIAPCCGAIRVSTEHLDGEPH